MHNYCNHVYQSKLASFLIFISLTILNSNLLHASDKTLTILNWAEYMDPKIVKSFEKINNAKIKEIYFETDDSRNDMMLANKGKGYDIIIVNGAALSLYKKRNWLAPITKNNVKNIKHIYKKWFHAFPGANGYAVPYFWGTMGIAYRSDLVKNPITHWRQLFEPEESLKGKILMAKSARELIGIALKANGHSMNSTNKTELDKAYALLSKQKNFVKDYSYIATSEKSSIVQGDIVAATSYNGDTLAVQEYNDKIVFIVPEEGTNLWADYMVVSKHSKNKKLAYKFINFINQPKNAAQLAQFVYFASPNKAAEKFLPKEFKEDKIIYPDKKTLQKSEIFKPLPTKILRKYNSIYSLIVN